MRAGKGKGGRRGENTVKHTSLTAIIQSKAMAKHHQLRGSMQKTAQAPESPAMRVNIACGKIAPFDLHARVIEIDCCARCE
jgi:hypothetical protein